MKYLVTGGTGMIGRQVVRLLCDAGHEVVSVSLDNIEPDTRAKYINLDLTHLGNCRWAIRDVDGVFHIAGIKAGAGASTSKIASHFVPTLMMNTNVLETCMAKGIKRVVYTSSIGVYANAMYFMENELGKFYGDPMDFAGWAKRMGELQIYAYRKQYGVNWAIIRPSNVYGPGDSFNPETAMVIPTLLAKALRGDDPIMIHGDGSNVRDFVYAEDVARGIIAAMEHDTYGQPLNLGGEAYTILELAATIKKVTGADFDFDGAEGGYPRRVMDIGLAKKILGYKPAVSLEQGIYMTWDWLIHNQQEYLKRKDYLK